MGWYRAPAESFKSHRAVFAHDMTKEKIVDGVNEFFRNAGVNLRMEKLRLRGFRDLDEVGRVFVLNLVKMFRTDTRDAALKVAFMVSREIPVHEALDIAVEEILEKYGFTRSDIGKYVTILKWKTLRWFVDDGVSTGELDAVLTNLVREVNDGYGFTITPNTKELPCNSTDTEEICAPWCTRICMHRFSEASIEAITYSFY